MKIGLYFGSFNPPHLGHIAVGHYAYEMIGLDEVWYVVSPNNPHKDPTILMDVVHRVNMTALALHPYPQLKVDTTELELPTPSYTFQTLMELQSKYPKNEWHLIIGEDNLPRFHQWRNVDYLKRHLQIWVYPRFGTDRSQVDPLLNYQIFQAPRMEISSTAIRERLRAGLPVTFLVGQDVADYLETSFK